MSTASRDGAAVLDAARAFITRFCALPSPHAYDAVTLWAAHAHVIDAFDSTPRLAFLSPEPGSGKTRALEVLELLVPNPMLAVNATPAALFRSVANRETRPTILFDEIDTVFGPKAKDNEELRGLFNAGHRRSGVAYRCVGDGSSQAVVAFPAYAALAVAGLGSLPDTILTRAVVIRMRRRAPGETVEPFRERIVGPAGRKLGVQLRDWAASQGDRLNDTWPEMPEGITDRPADVWEPLISIGDVAGRDWPGRSRAACLALARENTGRAVSLGVRLLGDLHAVFSGARGMTTEDILRGLHGLENAPWGDLRGEPLNPRGLARMLSQYQTADGGSIQSVKVKIDGRSLWGYRAADLADAWTRYLPPPAEAEPPEPPEPPSSEAMNEVPEPQPVPEPPDPVPEPDRRAGSGKVPRGSGTSARSGTFRTPSDLQGSGGSAGSVLVGTRPGRTDRPRTAARSGPGAPAAKHARQGHTPNQEARQS
jgi:hypothetical protein